MTTTRAVRRLDEGLYCVEAMHRGGGGLSMPVRSTILETGAGLAIVSPIAFDDASQGEIDRLGEVSLLIAPNRLHHLYLGAAQARWPRARTLGAPGLAQKRPDLAFDAVLAPGPIAEGLEAFAVEGAPSLSEHVFLHPRTRTLVVTDLVFHVRRAPNLVTWIVLALVARTLGRVRASQIFRLLREDRAAFARSLAAILALDFDRLVVAHGEVVETGGREALAEGLAWLVGPAALPAPGRSRGATAAA